MEDSFSQPSYGHVIMTTTFFCATIWIHQYKRNVTRFFVFNCLAILSCASLEPNKKTPEVLPAARVLTRNAGTISDAPVGRPCEIRIKQDGDDKNDELLGAL